VSDAEKVRQARKVIKGLLKIAELAMPDSYFETDRRVRAAKKWLAEVKA
jgi:hypothetical protein